jgi:hypothetical protein
VSENEATSRLEAYGEESAGSLRQFAPRAFAALEAVLELHAETELEDARRGHWEGHGSNERWVRDRPKWCPVCNVAEPCDTRRVIAETP